MKEYLLLFTIGPVQSFIGNSRKMRDLYAGSFLLSYLILHTSNVVVTSKSDIIINRLIPAIAPDKAPSAPNRILLKVSFSDDQCVKGRSFITGRLNELSHNMGLEVRSEFKNIYEAIFKKYNIVPKANVLAQLKDFPEVYWAYQEYSDKDDFEKITSKLQAVKSLRPFSQTAEDSGRKCSLFPEYNAIFYKSQNGNKPKYIDPYAIEFAGGKNMFYALKPGEGLSTLAFIKRMLYCIHDEKFKKYQYNTDIISVAYMLLKDRFASDIKGKALLKELCPEAAEAIFDLQNGFVLSEDEYEPKDISAAQELFAFMNGKKISPYYAIVKFDGDGMGDLYRICSDTQQEQLSKDIGKFAGLVPDIMKKYHGMCIYAGGEDFLGFLPTGQAIPAIMELREQFQKTVHHPLDAEKKLTFSAGIVFAHLMPPLENVLALTDEMEQMAKNNPGKDSFAITVSKRSGTEVNVCGRFGEGCETLKDICKISELIRSDILSVSSVYALLSVLDELTKNHEQLKEEMLKPLIISSICSQACKKENDEKNAEKIFALFKQYDCNIHKFIAALEIAAFLGKEEFSCITESML